MKHLMTGIVMAVAVMAGWSPATAGVVPVALGGAANTAFADAKGDDRQGGWTDQGVQDLHVIKPGRLELSGIPFEILSDETTGGKACIVLGGPTRPYLPKKAGIPVDAAGGEQMLYLLHAGAWCPANNEILGLLTLEYADGTSEEKHIRGGRDAMDWSQPRSGSNAWRTWSEYNGSTQVSLFVSKFPVKRESRLKAVKLESRGFVWMVVSAALGDDLPLTAITANWRVTQEFMAPTLSRPLVQIKTDKPPRNIILIIGDGMGQGAYDLTSLWAHGDTRRLVMQQLPVAGLCTTYSRSSSVTDSAAAGTAIACGQKVDNGILSMAPEGIKLKSIARFARELGKSVAIITSDPLHGATPSVFFANQEARGLAPEIIADAAGCGFDVLIGNADSRGLFIQNGKQPGQRNLQKEMETRGYQFIETPEAFTAVPEGARVVGQLEGKIFKTDEKALAKLTETAITRLSGDPDGFFMMVESTYPDKGGHGNDPNVTAMGTIHADWVAKVAVEYAAAHGDTLVICTADHETGELTAVLGTAAGAEPVIFYGGINHSSAPVPMYSYGPGAERFGGDTDNVEIGRNIARLWGFTVPAELEAPIPSSDKE